MANAGVEPGQIEAFYLGNFAGPSFVGQSHLAPYIAGPMGITVSRARASKRPARRAGRRSFTRSQRLRLDCTMWCWLRAWRR